MKGSVCNVKITVLFPSSKCILKYTWYLRFLCACLIRVFTKTAGPILTGVLLADSCS